MNKPERITDRIDAITNITEEYRKTILPAPKSVKIELTALCNYKCSFCARSQKLRDQKEMNWILFERLLWEMCEAGVEEIGLFYLGESFMSKRLEEAIYLAKKIVRFPYVFLTTNGSLSTPERVEQCFRNGLDSLKFSLNYSDEDQFAEIAQVKKKLFHKMIENIKAAKEIRDRVEAETRHRTGLYGSYIAYDDEQGKRMDEMVAEMTPYLDEVYALPLYNQAGFVTKQELEMGMQPTVGNRGRFASLVPPLPCWAVLTESHVCWDGKLSACCFGHDDSLIMADLTKVSFMEGWNSKIFQELRAAHLKKDVTGTACENCMK